MRGDSSNGEQFSGSQVPIFALWWLAGVIAAVAVMFLLPVAGVSEPISMGLGFAPFAFVSSPALIRLSRARYGVDHKFLPGLLWNLAGMMVAMAIFLALEAIL